MPYSIFLKLLENVSGVSRHGELEESAETNIEKSGFKDLPAAGVLGFKKFRVRGFEGQGFE